jgi:hypothetical protein
MDQSFVCRWLIIAEVTNSNSNQFVIMIMIVIIIMIVIVSCFLVTWTFFLLYEEIIGLSFIGWIDILFMLMICVW